jgi:hypothetical protein
VATITYPFLSSVENGWFAASLMVVRNAEPRVAGLANALLGQMNFGMFYNKDARAGIPAGLLRGGFWDAQPAGGFVKGNYLGIGPDVFYTTNHYDAHVSEPRIATYIGIAHGQIPPAAYYATQRTFPNTCDWSWIEQKAVGEHRTYHGWPADQAEWGKIAEASKLDTTEAMVTAHGILDVELMMDMPSAVLVELWPS